MLILLLNTLQEALGAHLFSLIPFLHMIIRGVIIYFIGVSIARFNKKLLGIRTPFNFILFVMLGSIFANAIVDVKIFLSIVGTMITLTLLNGLMTALAFYFPSIELLVKGNSYIIVQNGKMIYPAMRKNFITKREILNELHAQLHTHNLEEAESAILESDGSINFIKKKRKIHSV